MTVSSHDALCCLLAAVSSSAAEAGADAFDHVYASAAGTWPYCPHDAVVGRELGFTYGPPPGGVDGPGIDARESLRLTYEVFEVAVVRCGPPVPTENGCLDDLYGDCTSPASHSTLSGHHLLVSQERDRLIQDLMGLWCDCLVARDEGYSRTRPRWIESVITENQGRFTATVFTVATQLH